MCVGIMHLWCGNGGGQEQLHEIDVKRQLPSLSLSSLDSLELVSVEAFNYKNLKDRVRTRTQVLWRLF